YFPERGVPGSVLDLGRSRIASCFEAWDQTPQSVKSAIPTPRRLAQVRPLLGVFRRLPQRPVAHGCTYNVPRGTLCRYNCTYTYICTSKNAAEFWARGGGCKLLIMLGVGCGQRDT